MSPMVAIVSQAAVPVHEPPRPHTCSGALAVGRRVHRRPVAHGGIARTCARRRDAVGGGGVRVAAGRAGVARGRAQHEGDQGEQGHSSSGK